MKPSALWGLCRKPDPMLHLLENAELFDPAPRGRCQLLIAGDKVAWIGRERPLLPKWDVRLHDCEGLRVVPGFVDGHVHVTGGGGEDGFHGRVPPLFPGAFTLGGTTTVVGVLGADDVTRDTRSLVAATLALREQGLSAYCHTGGYHLPPQTLTGSVRDDIVFIDCILGVGEIAVSDHRSSQPSLDELLRIASDAHVAGMLANKAGLLHLHLGDGERGLSLVREALEISELPPRVFQPTHVNRRRALFEEAIALARRGVPIDVTAFPVADGEDAHTAAESVRLFIASGAPRERLSVSSDAGGSLPVFNERGEVTATDVGQPAALGATLAELLRSGASLADVLPAFTSNPANLLRLSRKGHIAVGSDADLVVLDGSGSPRDVMACGRWHVQDGKLLMRGTHEPKGDRG